MYYLKKEAYENIIPGIIKTDGTVIPERKYVIEERAIFKHRDFPRFYRGSFMGINAKYHEVKLYTCKTLKKIMEIRQSTFDYCNEWFDVYDETGKVDIENKI